MLLQAQEQQKLEAEATQSLQAEPRVTHKSDASCFLYNALSHSFGHEAANEVWT